MPRATNKYRFEWMILQWAWTLSSTFTGDAHYPFLILFNADGVAERLVFGPAPETHDAQEWEQARERASGWILFDPFDGPAYQYLCWEGLDQRTVERLIGATFKPEDLTAEGETMAFPRKWGVMF